MKNFLAFQDRQSYHLIKTLTYWSYRTPFSARKMWPYKRVGLSENVEADGEPLLYNCRRYRAGESTAANARTRQLRQRCGYRETFWHIYPFRPTSPNSTRPTSPRKITKPTIPQSPTSPRNPNLFSPQVPPEVSPCIACTKSAYDDDDDTIKWEGFFRRLIW